MNSKLQFLKLEVHFGCSNLHNEVANYAQIELISLKNCAQNDDLKELSRIFNIFKTVTVIIIWVFKDFSSTLYFQDPSPPLWILCISGTLSILWPISQPIQFSWSMTP